MEKGSYSIEFDADDSDIIKSLKEFNSKIAGSLGDQAKMSSDVNKSIEMSNAKSLKEQKKVYKQHVDAIKRIYKEQINASKGDLDKQVSLHKKMLDTIENAEKKHSARVKVLREQSFVGKKLGPMKEKFMEGFDAGGKGLTGTLMGVGKVLGPIGTMATASIGAVAAVFSRASEAAKEFETDAAKVATLLSKEDAKALPQAMEMLKTSAAATGAPLSELQGALGNILGAIPSMGSNLQAASAMAERAAKTAVGLASSTESVTSAANNLANSLGISMEATDNQDKIFDTLAQTMNIGVIPSGEALANAIAKAAPTMAALTSESEHALDAIGAMTAQLTANGVSVDESQTQMKALGNELLDTATRSKMMEMGLKGIDAQTGKVGSWTDLINSVAVAGEGMITQFSSVESKNALRILTKEGGTQFAGMITAMENAAGTADSMYETMAETSEQQGKRMDAAWNNIMISVGQTSNAVVGQVKGAAADALSWIAELFTTSEQRFQAAMDSASRFNEISAMAQGLGDVIANSLAAQPDEATIAHNFELIKSHMSELQAVDPIVAQDMEKILNNPASLTVESLGKINELLKEVSETAGMFAEADAVEAQAQAFEGLNDRIADAYAESQGFLGSLGSFLGITAGLEHLGFDVVKQQIADNNVELTKLREQYAQYKQEGNVEGIRDTQQDILDIQREQSKLGGLQKEINEGITQSVERALSAQIEANGGLTDGLSKADTLLAIQTSLPDEMLRSQSVMEAFNAELDRQLLTLDDTNNARAIELGIIEEGIGIQEYINELMEQQGVTEAATTAERIHGLEAISVQLDGQIQQMEGAIATAESILSVDGARVDAYNILINAQNELNKAMGQEATGKTQDVGRMQDLINQTKAQVGALKQQKGAIDKQIAELKKAPAGGVAATSGTRRGGGGGGAARKADDLAKKQADEKEKQEENRKKQEEQHLKDMQEIYKKQLEESTKNIQDGIEARKKVKAEAERQRKAMEELRSAMEEAATVIAGKFSALGDEISQTFDELHQKYSDEFQLKSDEVELLRKIYNDKLKIYKLDGEQADELHTQKLAAITNQKDSNAANELLLEQAASWFESVKAVSNESTRRAGNVSGDSAVASILQTGGMRTTKGFEEPMGIIDVYKKITDGIIQGTLKSIDLSDLAMPIGEQLRMAGIRVDETGSKAQLDELNEVIEEGAVKLAEYESQAAILNATIEQADLNKIAAQAVDSAEALSILSQKADFFVDQLREIQSLRKAVFSAEDSDAGQQALDAYIAKVTAFEEGRGKLFEGTVSDLAASTIAAKDIFVNEFSSALKNLDDEYNRLELAKVTSTDKTSIKDRQDAIETMKVGLQEQFGMVESSTDAISEQLNNVVDDYDKVSEAQELIYSRKQQEAHDAYINKLLELREALFALRKEFYQLRLENAKSIKQKIELFKLAEIQARIEKKIALQEQVDEGNITQTEADAFMDAWDKRMQLRTEDFIQATKNAAVRGYSEIIGQLGSTIDFVHDGISKTMDIIDDFTKGDVMGGMSKAGDLSTQIGKALLQAPYPLNIAGAVFLTAGVMTKIFTQIVSSIEEIIARTDRVYKAQLRRIDATEQQLTLMDLEQEKLEVILELNNKILEHYKRRVDEGREMASQNAQELTKIMANVVKDMNKLNVEAGFKISLPDFTDIDSIFLTMEKLNKKQFDDKKRLADLDELLDETKHTMSKKDRQRLEAERDQLNLNLEAYDAILADLDKYAEKYEQIDDLRRQVLREIIDEMTYQKSIIDYENERLFLEGKISETEYNKRNQENQLKYLEDRLEAQQKLEAQAMKDYEDELITLAELRDITDARMGTELEILRLKKEQNGEDTKALDHLRELHKARQEMILKSRTGALTQDEMQRIKDLERQIVTEMQAQGASPDAIQAAINAFLNAAPSYDTGTAYVPGDLFANIHEGERILTKSENEKLIAILNEYRDGLAPIKDLAQRYFQTMEDMRLKAYEGNSITISSMIINTQATDATGIAKDMKGALYTEFEKYHDNMHRRNGTLGGR